MKKTSKQTLLVSSYKLRKVMNSFSNFKTKYTQMPNAHKIFKGKNFLQKMAKRLSGKNRVVEIRTNRGKDKEITTKILSISEF